MVYFLKLLHFYSSSHICSNFPFVFSAKLPGLKGYQPAYFMRKNGKNWDSFSKEEKPEQKEKNSGHHHVG